MSQSITNRGSGTHNTGATSFTLSPTSNFTTTAGRVMAVLCVAGDNSSSGGATNDLSTVTDSLGNTWTSRVGVVFDNGAASAGVQGTIYTCEQNAGALTTATVITVSTPSSPVAKTWTLTEILGSVGQPTFRTSGAKSAGATSTTAAGNATTGASASVNVGEVILAAVFVEAGTTITLTGDSDATNGSWSTAQTNKIGTTTGGSAIISQAKVQTTAASTQSYDVTTSIASDYHAAYIITQEITVSVSSGTANGSSTASAVGSSTGITSGTVAGQATAVGTGQSTASSPGSAAGSSGAAATGTSVAVSSGTSAGTSAASAVGTGVAAATGASSGSASASAVGSATTTSSGAVAGIATASAGGSSVAASAGSVSGTATAAAIGGSVAETSGSVAGSSSANAVGQTITSAAGSAAGSSSANAPGQTISASAGSSTASSSAAAQGSGVASAAGSVAGSSSLSGTGSSTAEGSGNASGSADAVAQGSSVAVSSGNVSGASSASAATGQSSVGSAQGTSAASGTGSSVTESVGSSAGSSSASGVGSSSAIDSVGSADGTSTTSAEGSSVAVSSGAIAASSTAAAVSADLSGPLVTEPVWYTPERVLRHVSRTRITWFSGRDRVVLTRLLEVVMRQGELMPAFERHFFYEDGVVDFTLFTTIKFRMVHVSDSSIVVEGTATGDAEGNVTYSWSAGDTDVTGNYDAVIICNEGLANQQTFPTDSNIRVTITAAI